MKKYLLAALLAGTLPIMAMDDEKKEKEGHIPASLFSCGIGFDSLNKRGNSLLNKMPKFDLQKRALNMFAATMQYFEIEDEKEKEEEGQDLQPQQILNPEEKAEFLTIEQLRNVMLGQQEEIRRIREQLKKKQESEDKEYAQWLQEQE